MDCVLRRGGVRVQGDIEYVHGGSGLFVTLSLKDLASRLRMLLRGIVLNSFLASGLSSIATPSASIGQRRRAQAPLSTQPTEDAREEEKTSLLAALAAADVPHNFAHTWDAEAHPCDVGWDQWSSGWHNLQCNEHGRVVAVALDHQGWQGGELLSFARLRVLQFLDLRSTAIRGDISDIATLTTLRTLLLSATLVHGEIGSLSVLTLLGTPYTLPDGHSYPDRGLWLDGTNVHGPIAPLLALPGLYLAGNLYGNLRFSSCATSIFQGCEAVRLPPVPNADEVAGQDECACCDTRAQEDLHGRGNVTRDSGTGVCTVPVESLQESDWIFLVVGVAAGAFFIGVCVCCIHTRRTRSQTQLPKNQTQLPVGEFDQLVARPKRVAVVTDW